MVKYIVVGIDASGKTTLINELSKRTGLPVVKGSSFEITEGKTNDELFKTFIELAKEDNVIYDRFAYCNYVYANTFPDYASLELVQIRMLEYLMNDDDTVLIYLEADIETILERFKSRGEDYVKPEQVEGIIKLYEHVLENTLLNVNAFNTSEMTTDEIVDTILNPQY